MKADLIKYLRKINKKPSVQGKLLEQFISHGASTIPEMSKAIGVSLPTTTSALNELIKEGLAREIGKKDNSSGRIPMVYDHRDASRRIVFFSNLSGESFFYQLVEGTCCCR